jgi:hypothetical protein
MGKEFTMADKAGISQSMAQELAALRAENSQLKATALEKSVSRVSIKVSAKGAVSLYGFGKWPITLYKETWLKVFAMADTVKAFIVAHESELSVK